MIHLLLAGPFPIDALVLLGVAFLSGFGWSVGAKVAGRLL